MTDLEETLNVFVPTPREAMDVRGLQKRTDTKFLIPLGAVRELICEVAADYTILLSGDRRIAAYRTLYFDTPDLHFFHAHRRGYRMRQKVRIRQYVDRAKTFFEVKQRVNEYRTIKYRRERDNGDCRLHDDDLAFVGGHTNVQGGLQPQVWTDFRRVTLVGIAFNERVTIDCDLRFSGDSGAGRGPRNCAIVEVKQAHFSARSPMMLALRKHGFRSEGFSKYCAGIVALHPDIRHNRLLPGLRALERIEHG